jgi:glucuronide carrier protein
VTGRDDRPLKLRWSNYLGYAAGDVANNFAFSMSSMFLLLYYTDVVGISAAAVGTLFLVVRVWDGFADLMAGRAVDRTRSRWGKFRPWLLFGSLPLLLLNVAIFTVPDFAGNGEIVYAYVSYALFGLAYSLVNIPYGSLATAMTQDPDERARLASVRTIGTMIAILLLAVVVSPLIDRAGDLQGALTTVTLVLVPIGLAFYLATFLTAREQVRQAEEPAGLRETLASLRRNRPLVLLCLSSVAFLAGMFSLQTAMIFYARDVLGDASDYILLTIIQSAATFLAAALTPKIVRVAGKKHGYLLLGAVGAAGALGVAFAPGFGRGAAFAAFAVLGISIGGISTLMWALVADTVEYGEWQTGHRNEGSVYSVFSFTRKVGQAVGASAAAFIIGLGGYVAGASLQPDNALDAIKFANGLGPAVAFIIAVVIMLPYELTEQRFREIVRDLAGRRAGIDES